MSSSLLGTGTYLAQLGTAAIPTSGGAFTFHGSGGAQVGSFNATVNFPNPLQTWTNETAAAIVTRSSGLTITWSGGASGSYVVIAGTSILSAAGVTAGYTCIVPQSAGQFTVPSYILLGLPAGTGSTTVEKTTAFTTFTASGLDYGTAIGATVVSVSSTYK